MAGSTVAVFRMPLLADFFAAELSKMRERRPMIASSTPLFRRL
jgi:hypothetical protein